MYLDLISRIQRPWRPASVFSMWWWQEVKIHPKELFMRH